MAVPVAKSCAIILFRSAILCTSGCLMGEESAGFYGVWSDDDDEILMVASSIGGKSPSIRLEVAAPDSIGKRKPVTDWVPCIDYFCGGGGEPFDMYYFPSLGYALFPNAKDMSTVIWRDAMLLRVNIANIEEGSTWPIASALLTEPIGGSNCGNHDSQFLRVVPSPDGTIIAILRATILCDIHSYQDLGIEVVFLSYDDLRVVKSFYHLSSPYSDKGVRVTWMPDESFVVYDGAQSWSAWLGLAGPHLRPVDDPGCFFPETTSSAVSSEGVTVPMENAVDWRDFNAGYSAGSVFGCQVE
jgi:hypothetical protein